ncbi:bifunctional lytic transglycosylase/C40 family peptidase [Paenibacillus sp. FSL P2-0536]|uniref:bifunctional lytic transglycosylase/C40 family peptidase n=1 Tax=Paenibacillus sp. FSL P2-0536 TaxID=2921629 RepID=UPI0030FADE3A
MAAIAGKVAVEVIKDPDKAVKTGFILIFIILGFLMLLLLPVMLFFLPAAEPESYDRYYEAAQEIYRETGVAVSWEEMIAIDTVLKEQEIENIETSQIIKEYTDLFIVKTTGREETSCGYFDPPERKCYKDVILYSARTFEEVMSLLGLDDDQREQILTIMESDLSEMLSEKYQNTLPIGGGGGTAKVTESVLRWKPIVVKYAIANGIEAYVPYILAQIQQESSGELLDLMQCSESLGLPPNSITDPEYSINKGVQYFADGLKLAKYDVKIALQAYNFGHGFVNYAVKRGGYTKEVAKSYSKMMSERNGSTGYGDVNYVDNVMQYYSADGVLVYNFDNVYAELKKYEGWPYVDAGRVPSQGGFDCSGLLEYVFKGFGIKVSGAASDMFAQTDAVSESEALPGDLVFFKTTAKEISHVGMYIGNGKFYDANNTGIGESNLAYWKNKYVFKGFRRIK